MKHVILISMLVLILIAGKIQAEKVWLEKDGYAVIEVESVDQDVDLTIWDFKTEPAGFTGSGYLVAKDYGNMYKDQLVYNTPIEVGHELTFKIWIENPGEYAIHLWNIHQEADGDNDIWFACNDEPRWKVWDHHVNEFTWSEFDSKTWELERGINTLHLIRRSKGFGIDRLVLHKAELDSTIWGDAPESEAMAQSEAKPDAVTNLKVSEMGTAHAVLSWDAPENTTITDYYILWSSTLIGSTTKTSIVASGLQAGGLYNMTVMAKDVNSHYSDLSEPVEFQLPHKCRKKSALINYTQTAPDIDGKLEEIWHKQKFYPFTEKVDTAKDLDPGFRALWNEQNLYMIIEVIDDTPFPELADGVKSWLTDGIRVHLDPTNQQTALLGWENRTYQLFGKEGQLRAGIERDMFMQGVTWAKYDSVAPKRSWKPVPNGYTVELALPWTTLGVRPEDMYQFGLMLAAQDNDTGNGLESEISFPAETDRDAPNTWADALLVKSFQSGCEHRWLPEQIWQMQDGYAVVEAEDIDVHEHWVFKTEPKGYTGEGYLEWQGPNRSETPDGRGGNDDYSDERQGPQDEWLIVRVKCETPGPYNINVRNFHLKEDGDNDAWVWKVGKHITTDEPVRRMGDSLRDGEGFSWLDWGVRTFWLHEGINNIVIGGRSIGWGMDRIAIYQANNPKVEKKALNTRATPSARVE
jgi:hypothetical protein